MVQSQQSGAVLVTSADHASACIVHVHTSQTEVAALPSIVARLGAEWRRRRVQTHSRGSEYERSG
jgi:hypothetical protein